MQITNEMRRAAYKKFREKVAVLRKEQAELKKRYANEMMRICDAMMNECAELDFITDAYADSGSSQCMS